MHPIDNFICIKHFIVYSLFNSEFSKTYWYLTIWIFSRISYISNFVHYFDESNSWIAWVFLCFFIILHVVQFYYTFITHMLLISLPSSPALPVLWGAGWSWLTRSLLWSCSCDLPHGHCFNYTSDFPDFWVLVCILILQHCSVHCSSCSSDTYEGIAWLPQSVI